MKPIHLQLGRHVPDRFEYAICNVPVVSDTELPELNIWRVANRKTATGRCRSGGFATIAQTKLLYQGSSWIANDHRQVGCWSRRGELVLRIENLGDFVLSEAGCTLIESPLHHIESQWLVETMLGPGLILPLAYRGIFSLHASTVETGTGACAFLGESGQGKSTLAHSDGQDWLRIGDDILPISMEGSVVLARPHFPQLKLDPSEQYLLRRPAQVPLRRLFLLAPEHPDADCGPISEPLNRTEATLALIRHTVAAKLFPPEILNRHLHFTARIAASVPMERLRYPRRYAQLHELRGLIRERMLAVEG